MFAHIFVIRPTLWLTVQCIKAFVAWKAICSCRCTWFTYFKIMASNVAALRLGIYIMRSLFAEVLYIPNTHLVLLFYLCGIFFFFLLIRLLSICTVIPGPCICGICSNFHAHTSTSSINQYCWYTEFLDTLIILHAVPEMHSADHNPNMYNAC